MKTAMPKTATMRRRHTVGRPCTTAMTAQLSEPSRIRPRETDEQMVAATTTTFSYVEARPAPPSKPATPARLFSAPAGPYRLAASRFLAPTSLPP